MTLAPGDLVLVKSNGRSYRVARRLAASPYDHVAVVASDGRTINIDKPSARLLPLERLLRPSLQPLVLRPQFASGAARERFVSEIEALVSAPYDVPRTLALVERILERRLFGLKRPLRDLGRDRERWICTDAVVLGLERHLPRFGEVRALPLDWVAFTSATTNDLVEISRRRPDLLREVPLH